LGQKIFEQEAERHGINWSANALEALAAAGGKGSMPVAAAQPAGAGERRYILKIQAIKSG